MLLIGRLAKRIASTSSTTGIHARRSACFQPADCSMPTTATSSKNSLKAKKVQVVPISGMNSSTGRNVPTNEPKVEMA